MEVENEFIEVKLLLEAIFLKYGYDFRNYSMAHIKRRIARRKLLDDFSTIAEMIQRVLYDQQFFDKLLMDLSINVTEMFRDPDFFAVIRKQVVEYLKTYPFVKVWLAGCSTGEEVYSMAILLKEEGLYERTQVYATDFNQVALQKAKDGIYPIELVKDFSANYQKAGGQFSLGDYYLAHYDSVLMDPSLRERVVFADHNLVTDGVFGQMNMIICRNVIIYFDRELQNRVIRLFMDSLLPGGYLCMGQKESLAFSDHFEQLVVVDEKEKVFRKKYLAKQKAERLAS